MGYTHTRSLHTRQLALGLHDTGKMTLQYILQYECIEEWKQPKSRQFSLVCIFLIYIYIRTKKAEDFTWIKFKHNSVLLIKMTEWLTIHRMRSFMQEGNSGICSTQHILHLAGPCWSMPMCFVCLCNLWEFTQIRTQSSVLEQPAMYCEIKPMFCLSLRWLH